VGFPAIEFSYLALQEFELPAIEFPHLGSRAIVGIVMLIHMFFATLFVGYAVGSPILQAWGSRTGDHRMERLAGSIAHFNVLTFSVGATWAVMFLVLLVGLYPRVAAALFIHFFWFFPVVAMTAMVLTIYFFYIHFYRGQRQNVWAGFAAAFFILLWQAILTGIDTFMVTGGGAGGQTVSGTDASNPLSALDSIFNPMFITQDLHRTFANLSWPAYAVAAWAGFMGARAKSTEDRTYFDWVGSMGVIWGTLFLLLQPFAGFLTVYNMSRMDYQDLEIPGTSGPYDRLVGTGPGADSFTSSLLHINLILVVVLFVLSNVAMYLGAGRHPERAGQVAIRFFALVAAVAGLYSVSPLAQVPFLYMRYIMILIMVLATLGALVAYLRVRRRFRHGSPGGGYRAVLISLGVLAAVVTLSMGWMKSNSRVPYTIYGQAEYRVEGESPVVPEQLRPENYEAPEP
jgi:cytochrome d ubiquinol oxidase subunit I